MPVAPTFIKTGASQGKMINKPQNMLKASSQWRLTKYVARLMLIAKERFWFEVWVVINFISLNRRLTVCVTCVWAGVDSAWEQEKPEARKILENAAESHTSGARFVGRVLNLSSYFILS